MDIFKIIIGDIEHTWRKLTLKEADEVSDFIKNHLTQDGETAGIVLSNKDAEWFLNKVLTPVDTTIKDFDYYSNAYQDTAPEVLKSFLSRNAKQASDTEKSSTT